MDILGKKIKMDMNLLKQKPSMFYLKIGAMLLGAYIWGRITR